jgi:hypothetical protein
MWQAHVGGQDAIRKPGERLLGRVRVQGAQAAEMPGVQRLQKIMSPTRSPPCCRNAGIGVLQGEAHEGMTTAPGMYAEAVTRFLLGPPQVLGVTSRDRSNASTPGGRTEGVLDTNRTRTSHPPQNSLQTRVGERRRNA